MKHRSARGVLALVVSALVGALGLGAATGQTFLPLGGGAVDAAFSCALPARPDFIEALPDGKLLAVKNAVLDAATGEYIAAPYQVARLNRDGSLDSTFSAADAGLPALAIFGGLSVASDGSCILSPLSPFDAHAFPVTRLLADGSKDATYQEPSVLMGFRMPDGTVLKYEYSGYPSSPSSNESTTLSITHLASDGTVFGSDAVVLEGNGLGAAAYFGKVITLLDSAGRPVVFAVASRSIGTTIFGQDDTRIFRLTTDGSRDATFSMVDLHEQVISVRLGADDSLYYASRVDGSLINPYYTCKQGKLKASGAVDGAYQTATFTGGIGSRLFTWDPSEKGAYWAMGSTPDRTHNPVVLERHDASGALDSSVALTLPAEAQTASTNSYQNLTMLADGTLCLLGDFSIVGEYPANFIAHLYPEAHDAGTYLANVSIRGLSAPGEGTLVVGYVNTGTLPQMMLMRGIGPSLGLFGVAEALADPVGVFYNGDTASFSNDDWGGDALWANVSAMAGAFPLAADSKDSLIALTVLAGSHTYHVQTKGEASGICLGEIYSLSQAPTTFEDDRLVNVSSRATAGLAGETLIAGFSIRGGHAKRVLIRGVGPGLAPFEVVGRLQDPVLKVYTASGTVIASNDDWGAAQELKDAFAYTGAFALADDSKDSAVVLSLAPGNYTVHLTPKDGVKGIALIEVYEVR